MFILTWVRDRVTRGHKISISKWDWMGDSLRKMNSAIPLVLYSAIGVFGMFGQEAVYLLGPGDQFTVDAVRVAELASKSFRVESEGFVNFPMAGRFKVGGLSVDQLTKEL